MFAHSYGSSDEAYIESLAGMTAGGGRNWWDAYRDTLPSGLLDLAELEHHATTIRTALIAHIPGLFQTVDYARLIFRQSIPKLSPPEIEYRVSHRIKRQGILYRDNPTLYTAIIHEAPLRMRFGSSNVTREQLEHIVEMSERDNVTVLVIPYEAGIFPGAGQTVLYAEGPVPQLDTVQLDAGPLPCDALACTPSYGPYNTTPSHPHSWRSRRPPRHSGHEPHFPVLETRAPCPSGARPGTIRRDHRRPREGELS
ncbi:DUF5753 domain-containing protein [Streptomyces dysideae]|uniref:DUF5753 domain-containing protein n=1 Tax=Streptomyces dysideae TaxID=909626 RepID=UPI000A515DC4|nr:DUF5753 domain-containing protein [Streptomyces dysideae]